MRDRPAFVLSPRIVFGLVLVALGTLATLSNLGYDFDTVFEYWPVALILIGGAKLAYGSVPSGIFWVLAGALFLIPRFVDRLGIGDLWPGLLILIGLRMAWRSLGGSPRPRRTARRSVDENEVRLVAFFSSRKQRVETRQFRGGDLVAILGGCELDLHGAWPAGGTAVLDVIALWGGIDVKVPAHWQVSLEVTAVMGGAEDNRRTGDAAFLASGDVAREDESGFAEGEKPHLVVRGMALMGGVDVRI